MAAEGKSERAWCVVRFRVVADGLGFGSWWEAKRVLEGVLWMRELDGPGRRLWVELKEMCFWIGVLRNGCNSVRL